MLLTKRVQLLEYKTITLEARKKECDLYKGGDAEALGEDCWQVVNYVLTTDLQLKEEDFTVVNTFRVGKTFSDRNRSRLIFDTFANPGHVKDIMKNSDKLKGRMVSLNIGKVGNKRQCLSSY